MFDLSFVVLVLTLIVAAGAGWFLTRRAEANPYSHRVPAIMGAGAFIIGSLSLNIDLDPLWSSINSNFPIFFAILVVPAGIGIAIMLANFLIGKVREAFK